MKIMRPDSAQIDRDLDDSKPFSIEDERFDLLYPLRLRELSSISGLR
jgi:hypothetical protein